MPNPMSENEMAEALKLARATKKNEKPVPLREALTIALCHMTHREDMHEVCYDWCPKCKVNSAFEALREPTEDPELQDTMLDYRRRLEDLTTLCERHGLRVGFGKHGEVTLEDAR